jgi:hypothetical protein
MNKKTEAKLLTYKEQFYRNEIDFDIYVKHIKDVFKELIYMSSSSIERDAIKAKEAKILVDEYRNALNEKYIDEYKYHDDLQQLSIYSNLYNDAFQEAVVRLRPKLSKYKFPVTHYQKGREVESSQKTQKYPHPIDQFTQNFQTRSETTERKSQGSTRSETTEHDDSVPDIYRHHKSYGGYRRNKAMTMKDIKELCKANQIKLSKVVDGKRVVYKKKELITKLKRKKLL